MIKQTAFTGAGYGVSMAMAITYFIIVTTILLVISALISKLTFLSGIKPWEATGNDMWLLLRLSREQRKARKKQLANNKMVE